MKNVRTYQIASYLPIFILILCYVYSWMGIELFTGLFLFYFLVYRTILDYYRLKAKKLVSKHKYIKSFGFIRFKYLYEMMYQK
jgi:hypothetical protein